MNRKEAIKTIVEANLIPNELTIAHVLATGMWTKEFNDACIKPRDEYDAHYQFDQDPVKKGE